MIALAMLLCLSGLGLSLWCYLLIRAHHRVIMRAESTVSRSHRLVEQARAMRSVPP